MPPAAYDSRQVQIVLQSLRAQGILQPSKARAGEDVVIAYDLDALHTGFDSLVKAFPLHFLHCYAIKAAPMGFILQAAIRAGLGLEAASILEVESALFHGCPPEKIVFDSPAKTYKELDFALSKGIHINANTLEELDRIASILSATSSSTFPPPSIGLRINPLVGAGTIQELSVATATSKFGVPLTLDTSSFSSSSFPCSSSYFSLSNKHKVISYFHKYPWLTGLHIHVGSQGLGMDQLAQGVKVLIALTEEVEESLSKNGAEMEGRRRITTLDIGGGLAANYLSNQAMPTHAQLVEVLREAAPSLFVPPPLSSSNRNGSNGSSGSSSSGPCVRVVTEYGRSLTAKTAWLASRVEYAFDNQEEDGREGQREEEGGRGTTGLRTAILHAGADVLLRECYVPGKFYHRFTVHDKDGHLAEVKEGGKEEGQVHARTPRLHNLAGPLCFAGDVIVSGIKLPKVESGDWLVVHDVGGYTLALFSRYCSRAAPAVVGYRIGREGGNEAGMGVTVEVLQGREAGESVLEFWGPRGERER
ncbi:diaminopimelate decarboxylase [Nannochloropsis oceanica]